MSGNGTVEVPGVGEGLPIGAAPPAHTPGFAHGHEHGHKHGHGGHGHSHGHKPAEDEWNGEEYIAKPGAKEVALLSADSIFYALQQTGMSREDTKRIDLLEVGCGPGMVTDNLVPHFSSIHAIDVSPSMLLTFASRHSNPHITHSLHFLSPSSPSEFLTPLLSPLPAEQARRLQPPHAKYGVAVANLVLHHVDDWAGMMAGVQGLLVPGGWFVGTEFGREEGERDRVKEAREIVAAKKREAAGEGAQPASHGHHIHHNAMTPSEMYTKLKSLGFDEAHAEIRGELKLWPEAPAVPCLVFWARTAKEES